MAWQSYPIIGFAPDLPADTPGVIATAFNVVSTDRGIGQAPQFITEAGSALNTVSLGSALLSNTSATQEIIVGTATKLYGFDLSSTTTDRSGTAYSSSTTNTWSITQFGNIALAANLGDQLQQRTIGAAANFASVGAAPVPKASIVITAGPTSAPFVVVFDYNDGTNVDRDGWKCSAISDYTGWTAGTNQCATGRLLDNIPGPITAAIPYRDGIIAWKATGMYSGTYTGSPYIWSWQRISSDVGCIGKNACVEADDVIYWVDSRGPWMYDGSYPKPVPNKLSKWWAESASLSGNFTKLVWDKAKHLLWYIFSNGTSIPSYLTFNTVSGIWMYGGLGTGNTSAFENQTNSLQLTEFVSARWAVTSNKKMIPIAWTRGNNGPSDSSFTSWLFTDWVSWQTIKGIRPHYLYFTDSIGSSVVRSATCTLQSLNSEFGLSSGFLTPAVGSSVTASIRGNSGYQDGIIQGSTLNFKIAQDIGCLWEINGFTVDISSTGKK